MAKRRKSRRSKSAIPTIGYHGRGKKLCKLAVNPARKVRVCVGAGRRKKRGLAPIDEFYP